MIRQQEQMPWEDLRNPDTILRRSAAAEMASTAGQEPATKNQGFTYST